MAKFVIDVERASGAENEFIITETQELHRKIFDRLPTERYQFNGKLHTVVVYDVWGELDRDICLKVAKAYIDGTYNVYSYNDEKWSRGEAK